MRVADGVDCGRGVATDGGGYEVSDRDTDEMTLVELREELSELQDEVDFWEPYEGQEEVWDRRDEVWKALREQADVDIPECPECNGQHWGQAPGDPVECLECGWTATREVEEAVHDAWDQIVEGEAVATDGGVPSAGEHEGTLGSFVDALFGMDNDDEESASDGEDDPEAMTDGGLTHICENCGARYYGETAAETCCPSRDGEEGSA